MSYLVDTTGVLRLSDSQYIDSSMVVAWAEYQAWLVANTPQPVPALYKLLRVGVLRLADGRRITQDMLEWAEYYAWRKSGGIPEPMDAEYVPSPTLDEVKAAKIRAIRDEALVRVNVHLPDATDISTLILLRELYLSIAPAARQPTTAMTGLINIYQAMRTAINEVRACSTTGCVNGVMPNWP